MYENGQGHLTLFCIVFVWLRGRPSTVRSPIQDLWFMYQNRLGPSGGIYYPNFVPCFVVLYLNCWFEPVVSKWIKEDFIGHIICYLLKTKLLVSSKIALWDDNTGDGDKGQWDAFTILSMKRWRRATRCFYYSNPRIDLLLKLNFQKWIYTKTEGPLCS